MMSSWEKLFGLAKRRRIIRSRTERRVFMERLETRYLMDGAATLAGCEMQNVSDDASHSDMLPAVWAPASDRARAALENGLAPGRAGLAAVSALPYTADFGYLSADSDRLTTQGDTMWASTASVLLSMIAANDASLARSDRVGLATAATTVNSANSVPGTYVDTYRAVTDLPLSIPPVARRQPAGSCGPTVREAVLGAVTKQTDYAVFKNGSKQAANQRQMIILFCHSSLGAEVCFRSSPAVLPPA